MVFLKRILNSEAKLHRKNIVKFLDKIGKSCGPKIFFTQFNSKMILFYYYSSNKIMPSHNEFIRNNGMYLSKETNRYSTKLYSNVGKYGVNT